MYCYMLNEFSVELKVDGSSHVTFGGGYQLLLDGSCSESVYLCSASLHSVKPTFAMHQTYPCAAENGCPYYSSFVSYVSCFCGFMALAIPILHFQNNLLFPYIISWICWWGSVYPITIWVWCDLHTVLSYTSECSEKIHAPCATVQIISAPRALALSKPQNQGHTVCLQYSVLFVK